MIRGYYTAASGIVTQEKRLNNIANNLSNASTVGYKRENLVMGTFGEHITQRMNAYQQSGGTPIGDSVYMQVVDEKYTNYAQGGFAESSRPMDLSIMGDGFFLVADTEGNEYLSRDGQFSLDDQGYLILPGFGRVQGENGDIEVGTSDLSVDGFGNIYITEEDELEATQIDRLLLVVPDETATLEKVRSGLYTAESYSPVLEVEGASGTIRQYQLERSNVNMSDEMTEMIASQRALQSCSQLVKMYDEMTEKITTQVSRI